MLKSIVIFSLKYNSLAEMNCINYRKLCKIFKCFAVDAMIYWNSIILHFLFVIAYNKLLSLNIQFKVFEPAILQ